MSRESGFVLVGVVMFVLALTILGLTLFSLSGYEAEATHGSNDANAAYFAALSGIEHAKFVIAKRESLGAVADLSLSVDPNVVYARARLLAGTCDDTVSAIPNLPPNTAIELRVLAQVGSERRMLQANYIPQQTPNLYKRLISAFDFVHVKPVWHDPPNDILYSTMDSPYGSTAGVLQGNASLSWMSATSIDPTRVSVGSVPIPDLTPYFSRFWSIAWLLDGSGGNPHQFDLTVNGGVIPGGPSDVKFFKSYQDIDNDSPTDNLNYSVIAGLGGNPVVRVNLQNGLAETTVWLFDHGFRTEEPLQVHADPGDLLVFVSRPSKTVGPDNPLPAVPVGIWFRAGLDDGSDDIPVILVSDAQIVVEQFEGAPDEKRTNYLTLFCRSAWMAGARRNTGGTATAYWLHRANHPFDAKNGLIDYLCELGALPNSEVGGTRLNAVAGTWTELDPDNPPILD